MVAAGGNEKKSFVLKPVYFGVNNNIVTSSRYADCHCYPTAGYIVAAASVTEFLEICAVATQRKGGYEFHIRSND
jgi:hypothetical protein